jgi:hypothetical protein
MNSEKSENGADSSNNHASKLSVTAATGSKELDQLRSVGHMEQEGVDVELGPDQRRRDDLARLLIKIRRGEAGYDLIKRFLDANKGVPPETKV